MSEGKDRLKQFITVEKTLRSAQSEKEIIFTLCNLTKSIIDYHQSFFFSINQNTDLSLSQISSVAEFDPRAPYVLWLNKLFSYLKKDKEIDLFGEKQELTSAEIHQSVRNGWQEFGTEVLIILPIKKNNELLGLFCIWRRNPLNEIEDKILEELVLLYAHHILHHRLTPPQISWKDKLKSRKAYIIAAIFLLGFFPIRQNILAPAEIDSFDPYIMRSPLNGVIEDIFVNPGDKVLGDQDVLQFDETEFKNQLDVTTQALKLAEEKYRKLSQQAFLSQEGTYQLAIISSEMKTKKIEKEYYQTLLDKTKVVAPKSGVVLFADKEKWIGKSLRIGERILEIADENQKVIKIWVGVDDMINFEKDSDVKLFLDAFPLSPLRGKVISIYPKAEKNDQNQIGFLVKADLKESDEFAKIGLKGTAKIYGGYITLYYYIFRKPIGYIRKTFGI